MINKLRKLKEKPEHNNYYGKVARGLKFIKIMLCAVLVIGACAGFIFIDELSADSIASLFSYIDIIPAGQITAQEFRIDTDEPVPSGWHRNNIAVLRRSRLDIYDMAGRRSNTFPLAYSNPVLRVSERYMLAYDLGANKLDIFNLVSHVYEYMGEEPIFGARLTDRGNIAYITRETGYTSVIRVLNNNFSEIYAVYRVHDFIMDADISGDAGYLAAAGYYAEDGDYLTSILLYKTDSERPVRDIKIRGEEPYRVKINNNGFCAVLEKSIRFYDFNGDQLARYDLAGRTIQLLELGAEYAAVILNERTFGNDNRILIFDKFGERIWDLPVDTEILDIKFDRDYKYLYFLTRGGLYKIDLEARIFELLIARVNGDGESEYDETAHSIIFADERNIFLAGLLKINILENN